MAVAISLFVRIIQARAFLVAFFTYFKVKKLDAERAPVKQRNQHALALNPNDLSKS